tara:strand:- start:352 stop:510 length:159 start_codon:yes stop_codon:yes gene_type:complete
MAKLSDSIASLTHCNCIIFYRENLRKHLKASSKLVLGGLKNGNADAAVTNYL